MSIQSEISRIDLALDNISEAKSAISSAIIEKGVNVPTSASLSEYPALISNISARMNYDKDTVYSLSLENPSVDFVYTGKMYNSLQTYEEGDELSSHISYYYEPHSINVTGGLTVQNILFSRYYSDRNLQLMLNIHFKDSQHDTYIISYRGEVPETLNDENAYEAIKQKNGTTLQLVNDTLSSSTATEYFNLPDTISASLIVNDEAFIVKKAEANPNIPAFPPLKSDSGGGSDKTYVYTVTGADIAEANGNYYQDGTLNGYPAYTNGTYWLIRATSAYNNWAFFAVKPPVGAYTGYAYYKSEGDSSTPINISEPDSYRSVNNDMRMPIIVAEYSGSSSGGESGGESGGGSASGPSLRLTSSSVANGCAQVYNLTSGDPSSTPTAGSNSLVFTGVTDSTWTIVIEYEAEFSSIGFFVKQNGNSRYNTGVRDYAWQNLADTVAQIQGWSDASEGLPVDITLTVEESGSGG